MSEPPGFEVLRPSVLSTTEIKAKGPQRIFSGAINVLTLLFQELGAGHSKRSFQSLDLINAALGCVRARDLPNNNEVVALSLRGEKL